jgi:hypothetical protein
MKCFYHPGIDAVGVCKNCNKGLCADSAVDVGDGLACVGACEQRVRDLNTKIAGSKPVMWALVYVLLGLLFGAGGGVLWYDDGFSSGWFLIVLGAVLVVAGWWNLVAARRWAARRG